MTYEIIWLVRGINITISLILVYFAYKKFNLSLDDIMLKLNHQSIQSTKRYIGLTQEEKYEIENVVSF